MKLDQRDTTKKPPAMLSPIWVLRMRLMLLDAKENGDKPWPYGAKGKESVAQQKDWAVAA